MGDPLDSVHNKQRLLNLKQKAQVVKIALFLGTATTLFRDVVIQQPTGEKT
jgi:hypothetical protein